MLLVQASDARGWDRSTKCAHGRQYRTLLAATESSGRDEYAHHLAVETARRPLLAGFVPECLGWRKVSASTLQDEPHHVVHLGLPTFHCPGKLPYRVGIPLSLSAYWHSKIKKLAMLPTNEESIIVLQCRRIIQDGNVSRLRGSMHLGEDILGESLCDPGGEYKVR